MRPFYASPTRGCFVPGLSATETNWDRCPWACILAAGPTGTGKTETARRLAEILFGGRLICLHCCEVGPEAAHATSMWTGAPPGYVGHGRGGVLTNHLRRHRNAVVLFDEIEKAAPGVIEHILIPLLGEGTVTDRNTGETLWATDCVVFCTSNVGAQGTLENLGEEREPECAQRQVERLLERRFRPEVMARFHAILHYRALGRDTQWRVWTSLQEKLAAKVGPETRFVLDDAAKRLLERHFSTMLGGARAIGDLFREQLVPLALDNCKGEAVTVTADETGRLGRAGRATGAMCIADVGKEEELLPGLSGGWRARGNGEA